jgi:hypothetical protein
MWITFSNIPKIICTIFKVSGEGNITATFKYRLDHSLNSTDINMVEPSLVGIDDRS